MSAKTPEGRLKAACRDDHARPNDLLFIQIEGKGTNGVPDSLCERVRGGVVFVEFKRKGQKPNDQQWLRIWEFRNAGIEAWWADDVQSYRAIVGLDSGGYEVVYTDRAKRIIRKAHGWDAV